MIEEGTVNPSPLLDRGTRLESRHKSLISTSNLPGITSVNPDKLHFVLSDFPLSTRIEVG